MDIVLLREYIQHYGLYMQLAACLAYIWRFKTADAFVYMCVGILLLTPLHVVYENYLLALSENEDMRTLVRNLWYFGFALTDIMLVAIVIHLTKKEHIKLNLTTKALMASFLLMALIQIAGYVDQVVINTDYLANFYMASIPIINIGVTIIIVSFSAGAFVGSLVSDDLK